MNTEFIINELRRLPESWNGIDVLECIGKGACGVVYRVRNNETGSEEALKVVSIPKFMLNEELGVEHSITKDAISALKSAADRIIGEAEVLNQFRESKHIVNIYDSCTNEAESEDRFLVFIRMELLEGWDMKASEVNSEMGAIKLGVDICDALMECEEKRVLHRDIKPANILVDGNGEYKLCDFGISQDAEGEGQSVEGTFMYMAPEVYMGMEYDCRSDIYSLGLVLYQMLNRGTMPFLSMDAECHTIRECEISITNRLMNKPMNSPCRASAELAEVVMKACAYNREERFHSAAEMKDALLGIAA